jgi:hypothetical protein
MEEQFMQLSILGIFAGILILLWQVSPQIAGAEEMVSETRAMRFKAQSPDEARIWQKKARDKLFELMMGGHKPKKSPLDPKLIKRELSEDGTYFIEELTLRSLPDREVHVWLAIPKEVPEGGLPGMLALHGHGGTGEKIVKGEDLYWYGKAFAQRGYAVATLDIGQHELQHEDWSLMGERTWDALACLDYLCGRPEVDATRVGTAGLSLGGETVMYVAALDKRIKMAVSSGWLTTIANMKNGHCPCWNFPGLEEHFDFSDIFACVAPRYLMMQIGLQEKAPGGFPIDIAREAFEEIQSAYKVFGKEDRCVLDVHEGGHVFNGEPAFEMLKAVLKR